MRMKLTCFDKEEDSQCCDLLLFEGIKKIQVRVSRLRGIFFKLTSAREVIGIFLRLYV